MAKILPDQSLITTLPPQCACSGPRSAEPASLRKLTMRAALAAGTLVLGTPKLPRSKTLRYDLPRPSRPLQRKSAECSKPPEYGSPEALLPKNDLPQGARTRRWEAGEPPVPCFCCSALVPVAAHALLPIERNGQPAEWGYLDS
jgi:hypothetical protein